MIKRVDVPLRQRDDGRLQSSADLHMVMDIFETVLFNDDIETFILGTGDKDFTRVSAMLVNRFGKRVVICGVPGSISQVLSESATVLDPLDPEEHGFGELEMRVAGWLDWMADHWDHPMYMGIVRYLSSRKPSPRPSRRRGGHPRGAQCIRAQRHYLSGTDGYAGRAGSPGSSGEQRTSIRR